eukprot:473177_1
MDTNTILAGLKHPNYAARYSAISSLRSSIKDNKGQLTASTLNKIFCRLSESLLDTNWSVIQATILLLGELSPEILDLPQYIPIVLPNLIRNLGNMKGVIRRSTLSTLVIFVKQLYSAELVVETLISVGFIDNDARVRQGAILVIPQIIGPNTNGINLKLLLKSLIFRLLDENAAVMMSTQQSIAYLSKIRKKEFSKIQNELDHESFTVLTQHHHDIHNALLQQFQDAISYQEIQRFSNIQMNDEMTLFEIIKPTILSKLLHCTRRHDWHGAGNVAQDILASVRQFCKQSKGIKKKKKKRSNDLKQLILFLCRFLEIDSQKIISDDAPSFTPTESESTSRYRFVMVFVTMLDTLIEFDRASLMHLAPYYMPRLVELMSYSSSNIVSKKSLQMTRKLYAQSSVNNWGIILLSFADVLQQTTDIMREEIVNNMMRLLLYHEHIDRDAIDFQMIVNNLAKVLNQAKSKLSYLIIECLAVMHDKLGTSLLTMLQNSTMNANDMNVLRERFKAKKLPILGKNGNISFRHKNINKTQNEELMVHPTPKMKRKILLLSSANPLRCTPNIIGSPTASLRSEPLLKRRNIDSLNVETTPNKESKQIQIQSAPNIMKKTMDYTKQPPPPPRNPQRTHSAPMHHRHAAIAGQLSLLKKRKARATSAHSSNIVQQQSLSNSRAKSFSNIHHQQQRYSAIRKSYGRYPMTTAQQVIGLPHNTTHIASDQLTACANPERDMKNIIKQIQSKQWNERLNALNTIRKISYHHQALLCTHLAQLCRYIGVEINSLRSTLSRIAIITVTDLFICFGRSLESNKCIDSLIPNLMRRAGEMSNEFISSAADKAMYAMIDHISIARSLAILLSHSQSKSPPIRSKVAMYLQRVVSVAGVSIFNYRDYKRLIRTIGAFLNDGAVNTRNHAKAIIIRLNDLNKSEFSRNLKQYLSLQQYSKVESVLLHKQRIVTTRRKSTKQSMETNNCNLIISNSFRDEEEEEEEAKALFDDAFGNLNSSDWKKRLLGLNQIAQATDYVKQYTVQHIVTIMDHVAQKLCDSNAKVAICAINHLRNMIQKEHIRSSSVVCWPQMLKFICQPLCANMAAANPLVRKNSQEAINEIMVIAPAIDVVQSIAQVLTFSNSRIKTHCLAPLTDAVFKMKMLQQMNEKVVHQILCNSVIPSIQSALNLSKPSTQSDLRKLIRIVHSMLGTKQMLNCKSTKNMSNDQIQKIKNMIQR